MRIRWTRQAAQNLDEISDYVTREYPAHAPAIMARLLESIEKLADAPGLGRPGRIAGTRELVIRKYPYIVPYRVQDNEVHILRVFHARQKPPETW